MSELRADTITASNGTSPVTLTKQSAAKAYVLWNNGDLDGQAGTTGIDTSFNVTSMDDDGTGDFGVNFTNAFSSANYTAVSATGNGSRKVLTRTEGTATSSAMDGLIRDDSNGAADAVRCSLVCNGDLA
jgi:hypothetical protein